MLCSLCKNNYAITEFSVQHQTGLPHEKNDGRSVVGLDDFRYGSFEQLTQLPRDQRHILMHGASCKCPHV